MNRDRDGVPVVHDAPVVVTPLRNGRPGEPEKLVLPAAGVRELLEVALRTEPGAALWRGFVIAHGEPSWLCSGAPARPGEPRTWALRVHDAEVVPTREQ